MFIYSDFKMLVSDKRFEDAKSMLADADMDTTPFGILADVSMFLSLLFRYPEEDVYDTLSDNWASFGDFFSDYISSTPSLYDITEMQSDFIKLFKQDFKGNKIVPYISYYTEENKMLYGESTVKIREWMAEEGFCLDKSAAELEDNMYIVLEFLSTIFTRLSNPVNIEEWYRSLGNLYHLLDTYGLVIADDFAGRVAVRDDMPFYAECAKLLQAFVKDVDVIMEDILSPAS